MVGRLQPVECFESSELRDLKQTFDDAWSRLAVAVPSGHEDQVREAIARAIFDRARAGQTDRELLRSDAMREGRRAISSALISAPTSASFGG